MGRARPGGGSSPSGGVGARLGEWGGESPEVQAHVGTAVQPALDSLVRGRSRSQGRSGAGGGFLSGQRGLCARGRVAEAGAGRWGGC